MRTKLNWTEATRTTTSMTKGGIIFRFRFRFRFVFGFPRPRCYWLLCASQTPSSTEVLKLLATRRSERRFCCVDPWVITILYSNFKCYWLAGPPLSDRLLHEWYMVIAGYSWVSGCRIEESAYFPKHLSMVVCLRSPLSWHSEMRVNGMCNNKIMDSNLVFKNNCQIG